MAEANRAKDNARQDVEAEKERLRLALAAHHKHLVPGRRCERCGFQRAAPRR